MGIPVSGERERVCDGDACLCTPCTLYLSVGQVNVVLYVFDLLYYNGESLLREPLMKRRQVLRDCLKEVPDRLYFARSMTSEDTENDDIQHFLNESIKGGCEGLMVKTLDKDASYEPSRRTFNWLKVCGCGCVQCFVMCVHML